MASLIGPASLSYTLMVFPPTVQYHPPLLSLPRYVVDMLFMAYRLVTDSYLQLVDSL